MPSFSSRSRRLRQSSKPNQTGFVNSVLSGHHATVNCLECNRLMAPRVVTYYGQPLRSICPFCGATFAKFPSGLQRLLQRFHTRKLSFTVFFRLLIIAIGFAVIGYLSSWEFLPRSLGRFAIFGTIVFAPLALAELIFQCVEIIAAKFSHQSNHYWAAIVLLAMFISNQVQEATAYLVMFFIVMLIRWFISGLAQFRESSHETHFNN